MTFLEMQTAVRSRLREPAAQFFTDAEIKRWVNFGYKDFIVKSGMWTHKRRAFAMVANQAEYSLPTDYISVDNMKWRDREKIDPADEDEFTEFIGFGNQATSTRPLIALFYPWDTKFRPYPKPSAASAATAINDGAGINTTVTSVTVDSTTDFPDSGVLIMESEQIRYYAKTATTFTQLVRGDGFTTAATHADDIVVDYGEIELFYRYDPPDMSADSDLARVATIFHEALVLYATRIGLQKQKRNDEALDYKAEYLSKIKEAKMVVMSKWMDRGHAIKAEEDFPNVFHSRQ